jgi:hypothetical protein
VKGDRITYLVQQQQMQGQIMFRVPVILPQHVRQDS